MFDLELLCDRCAHTKLSTKLFVLNSGLWLWLIATAFAAKNCTITECCALFNLGLGWGRVKIAIMFLRQDIWRADIDCISNTRYGSECGCCMPPCHYTRGCTRDMWARQQSLQCSTVFSISSPEPAYSAVIGLHGRSQSIKQPGPIPIRE